MINLSGKDKPLIATKELKIVKFIAKIYFLYFAMRGADFYRKKLEKKKINDLLNLLRDTLERCNTNSVKILKS